MTTPAGLRIIIKVLDIFRLIDNYVGIGEDEKTPAMRQSLRMEVSLEDMIHYEGN